ncbi:ATP-binding cassette domain-containing protein [Marinomonas mediterranea]|jgi:ATPase components of various ABC-type transport systems, contain duplicated ATPase|uniref:Nickel-transporting ATPase n=1 Tax=Marinomonas mediterranea (strain ATCC 700492 / JCM 21426 / NBRC 103028 / MMB-1) TaxID=717774 RepID=F2K331_MARM1|nr:ATP-binding cassette domain-containing protein [Marinomonas mediterranea]ADZ90084.1 Nickel-transporting ATPase [Marinomonas mediterranea MMB-1]WCN16289.1 ATP-binding cassette domain-containing protein [Marinomonas mediterranea MMB-1]
MPQFALELCDLSRHFMLKNGAFKAPTLLKAVDGVSLRIAPGETLGLVGESGCGKSTLVKMILGLLPPTEGNVLVNDKAINHGDRLTLAKQLQPIFQDPYSSLNPRKTIRQIICLPLQLHKVGDKKSQQAAVKQMSDLVGLPERLLDQYPGQLSGGQRQRVAIARALILKPSILVCDEPTSALDVSVQAQILNLLMDLKQELGLTYLFISHNLGVVEHLVDRVAVMYRGQLVEQGSREDIFQNAQHPYTQALLSSVLTPEPALGLPELIDDSAWASAS